MFFDPPRGEVLDFVGGQADLAAGIVRAIGDPHARMREDKLRFLRAVRFAAVFDFQLDPVTSAAVREMAGELSVVSVERIAQELRKMLLHPNRRRAIELCPRPRIAGGHPARLDGRWIRSQTRLWTCCSVSGSRRSDCRWRC